MNSRIAFGVLALLHVLIYNFAAAAVREDMASTISWQILNVGTPTSVTDAEGFPGLLIVGTAENVIACYNSTSASIAWRQTLNFVSNRAQLLVGSGSIDGLAYAITSPSKDVGLVLTLFSIKDGFFVASHIIDGVEEPSRIFGRGSTLQVAGKNKLCSINVSAGGRTFRSECRETGTVDYIGLVGDQYFYIGGGRNLYDAQSASLLLSLESKISDGRVCGSKFGHFYYSAHRLFYFSASETRSVPIDFDLKELCSCASDGSLLLLSASGTHHLLSDYDPKENTFRIRQLPLLQTLIDSSVGKLVDFGDLKICKLHNGAASTFISAITEDGSWHVIDLDSYKVATRYESLSKTVGPPVITSLPLSNASDTSGLGFLANIAKSVVFTTLNSSAEASSLKSDKFGFNQLIVAVLNPFMAGRYSVTALESHTGKVAWKRFLPCNSTPVGNLFVLPGSPLEQTPRVGIVCDAKLVTVDALSGFFIATEPLDYLQLSSNHALLSSSDGKTLVQYTRDGGSGIKPAEFGSGEREQVWLSLDDAKTTLSAYRVTSKNAPAHLLWEWKLKAGAGTKFLQVESDSCNGVSASAGIVQEDRSVLYNWVDMRFVVVTRVEMSTTLYVSLLDSWSGKTFFETFFAVRLGSSRVTTVVCNSWAAVYFEAARVAATEPLIVRNSTDVTQAPQKVKVYKGRAKRAKQQAEQPRDIQQPIGPQLLLLEWFQSNIHDSKVADSGRRFLAQPPYVRHAMYSIAQQVRLLSVTKTRHGVATRQILLYTESGQIFALRMPALGWTQSLPDLRKVMDKSVMLPLSSAALPSLLALLPLESPSHRFLLQDLKHLQTVPTFLESTCLIVASGLDWFQTQTSPSRQFDMLDADFTKFWLGATILFLVCLIKVLQGLVARKSLQAAWS